MSWFHQYLVLISLAFLTMMFAILVGGCATTSPYEEQTKVVCPEGTRSNSRFGTCDSVCEFLGEKYSPTTKGCVSICGNGFRWDGFKCVSLCKGETTWDDLNSSCVCPSGKFPTEMGRCLTAEELRCEEEKLQKVKAAHVAALKAQFEAENAARSTRSKCKAGTKWDIIVDQCISICKGGTWNDAQGTCLCPQGEEWIPVFGECRNLD